MASKFDLHLPSKDFLFKALVALAAIMLVVRLMPDKWGVAKYFMPLTWST